MKILCIIPAREGSKGIVNKNIQKLNGKHLIEYSISCAKNSDLVNRIIVSTDGDKIAKISKKAGAEIPFKRPKKWSHDKASQLDVIKHTLEFLEKSEAYFPDIITILHPTNPFVTSKNLDKSIRKLRRSKADLVLGVMAVKTHPFRSFWHKSQFLEKFSKDFDKYYQRQTFPKLYSPTGDIYTFRYSSFKKYGKIFGPKIEPLIYSPEEITMNIDSPYDLFLSEMTMKFWEKYKKSKQF
jgi:N-acylneuraminate cytidylyltransferase/CMP-N,N'-diacetyllegionaminic acid synthase